jgi:hypothetical protein
MISTRRHGPPFCTRHPALLGIMAVLALTCFAASTTSRASPITYELSGVTGIFPLGTVTLTGNFTYDPASSTLDSVSITATGPTTLLNTSPETFDVVLGEGLRFIAIRDPAPVPPFTIVLRFSDALGGLSPNRIVGFDVGNGVSDFSTSDVTGAATPLAVPEPSGIVLLAGGVSIMYAARKLRRRKQWEPGSDIDISGEASSV